MRTEIDRPLHRRRFAAMGTSVELIAPMDAVGWLDFQRAARSVEREFAEQEQRFSRFRDDSELSAVNRADTEPVQVTRPFAELVTCALRAAADTEGLFDPTVLPAMIAAGYDRSFEDVIVTAREVLRPAAPTGRWREVELEDDLLRLPAGVSLDLGGIAKGWTVDRAASRVAHLLPWGIVDAGGDLCVFGDIPPEGVEIGVEHLIDPRTGRPALTDVVQATVWAPTCVEAEVAAKVALLGGPGALDRVASTLVLRDGTVISSMPRTESRAASL